MLQRLQQKTEGFPAQPSDGNRYMPEFADDIDSDYILDTILDHAGYLISSASSRDN